MKQLARAERQSSVSVRETEGLLLSWGGPLPKPGFILIETAGKVRRNGPPPLHKLTHHNIYTQSSSGAWNESLLHSSSSWLAQLTLFCVHGCVCVHAPVKTGALSLELVLLFVSVSFLLLNWPNVLVFSPLFQSIMEQFNPCLRNFIAMGKSYEKALTSEYTNHFLFSLCLRPSFIPPVCLSSSPGRGQTDPTLEAAFISS